MPAAGTHGQIWINDTPDGCIGNHGFYYRTPRPAVQLSLIAATGRHQRLTFDPLTGTASLIELCPAAAAADFKEHRDGTR